MSIIKINVHPYVKKVLIKEFGEEPIFAAQNNIIGIIIRPTLKDKSEDKRHIRGVQSETLQILLPKRLRHLSNNKKSDQAVFIYETDLIKLKFSLQRFVNYIIVNNILCYKNDGVPTMKAFEKVYSLYQLDEDLLSLNHMMHLYKNNKRALSIAYHKKIKNSLNIGGNNQP